MRTTQYIWHGALLVLGMGLAFWLYASKVDVAVHSWAMQTFSARWMQDIWGLLSRMGQAWFQIVACVVFGVFYYWRCQFMLSAVWYRAIPVFLVVGMLAYPMKVFFGRPRPKLLHNQNGPDMYDMSWFEMASNMHAFPSGHTITTFALLATLWPFYPKARYGLLVLACVLGFARVGIGSHYLGDVVAGATLGYLLSVLLSEKWVTKKVR